MTDFNFDEMTQRRGTLSMKWDGSADPDIIPMWVADMDFETSSYIEDALVERAKMGIYGCSHAAICFAFSWERSMRMPSVFMPRSTSQQSNGARPAPVVLIRKRSFS